MQKLKVLLADDEPDFRRLMGLRIRKWGYSMLEAADGEKALAILKKKVPDIVILDYKMPKLDGVATLRAIRKINKSTPVIMFTAYPEDKAIESAKELNVAAFIPKLSAYSDTNVTLQHTLDMLRRQGETK